MKTTYIVDPKENAKFCDQKDTFLVEADSYESAAQKAAIKMHGRKRGLSAVRTTGNTGMSGMFNAYLPCETGGQSSYGYNFHVRKF